MRSLVIVIFILLILSSYAEVLNYDDIYITYHGSDGKIASKLGRQLADDIGEFQKKAGHYPDLKTQIVIATDHAEYQSFVENNGGIQEFSQAIFKRNTNTIYIRNPRDNLRFDQLSKILLHEYIHSFVFHYFTNAPLWFHEGMAVFFSNDFGTNRELGLARDYLFGNTRTLSQMRTKYPHNRIEWEAFYSKSALAVRYLFQNKKTQFYRMWDLAENDHSFNSVFLKSIKYTTLDFSIFFEEYCATHFRSEIILALSGMIWLFFPLLFMIGYFRRRHKLRMKLAIMEAEEKAEETFLHVGVENGVDAEDQKI